VLEDVLIRNDAERSEDDDDRDVGSDVRKRRLDRVSVLHGQTADCKSSQRSGQVLGFQRSIATAEDGKKGRGTNRLSSMVHLDLHHADRLPSLLDHASDLGQEIDRRRLGFGKDVDVVGRHSLLGDKNLFGSVDDEISSLDRFKRRKYASSAAEG
jgi:hypothetical protein